MPAYPEVDEEGGVPPLSTGAKRSSNIRLLELLGEKPQHRR